MGVLRFANSADIRRTFKPVGFRRDVLQLAGIFSSQWRLTH
jgi:hypothetical protein